MKEEKQRIFRMSYYIPSQSREFSHPQVFETSDMGKLQEAISVARDKGYDVVRIESIS